MCAMMEKLRKWAFSAGILGSRGLTRGYGRYNAIREGEARRRTRGSRYRGSRETALRPVPARQASDRTDHDDAEEAPRPVRRGESRWEVRRCGTAPCVPRPSAPAEAECAVFERHLDCDFARAHRRQEYVG